MKKLGCIIMQNHVKDCIGAQITWYICQLIYGHYHNYYIEYNDEKLYSNSIFTLALKKYINEYNRNKFKGNYVNIIDSYNWCKLNSKIVTIIKSDLISYFKEHLFKIRDLLDEYALSKKYSITFNPKETILIHLKLDDKTQNNLHNYQIPEYDNKIESVINKIKMKNPQKNYKVLIITSPIGNETLNYPIIRSGDPSLDLFYLCNSECVVILSQSTFALSTLYFSRATEFWIPKWSHVGAIGLETNYCKSKFNYFD